MHPQTWTGKDSGEAAIVVSYQQSYDKKIRQYISVPHKIGTH
jgi:hypothetical protein